MNEDRDGSKARDRLSAGLREAFSEGSTAPGSVLERLFPKGTPPVRVLLRERSDESEPMVRKADHADVETSRSNDRYQLHGEIARGGIGVILRSRDVDLGRDIAMKVLREEHRDDSSLIERFVEEAQVGAQLQHPGIVPVYDFGLREDQRPYFTMKLVKGRTLAALLAERTGREDTRRFVGIFEQVCQTVAYAHSRGVVHRDLKPSNIMVGAFGEVQVVDWGLSKVLRQGGVADERQAHKHRTQSIETVRSEGSSKASSDSLAGSVMGTPAYMPPEQARGDVDSMDERADVFALGAILCEILTGSPPYGEGGARTLDRAADANLADAHQKLVHCGASPELIEMCSHCLQPKPSDRPAHAGVLAAQIAEHISGVEKRAEEAKISAALEREKTASARKAQRLTLAVAGSLLAVLGLGVSLLWLESTHQGERAALASRVRAELSDIRQLQGRAEAAPVGELKDWTQARVLLSQVGSLLDGNAANEELREEVETLESSLEAGYREALTRREEQIRDDAMLEALDEAVSPQDAWRHDEPEYCRQRSDGYRAAFEAYGVDVFGAPENTVASRIADSNVAASLVVALDDWASALHVLGDQAEQRLRRIAEEADRDPWRRELRELLREEGIAPEALRSLASEVDVGTLPAFSVVLLARELIVRGHGAEAIELLEAALFERPDEYLLAMQLGAAFKEAVPPDWRSARAAFSNALSINPRRPAAWYMYGFACDRLGDWEHAMTATRRSIELGPDDPKRLLHLSHLLRRARPDVTEQDRREAVEACRQAVALAAEDPRCHYELGLALRGVGEERAAMAAFGDAVDLEPSHLRARLERGLAMRESDDVEGAKAAFQQIISLGQDDPAQYPIVANACVHLAHLLHSRGTLDQAIGPLELAIELQPEHLEAHVELGHGYELGARWAEAIEAWEAALALEPDHPQALDGLGLAHANLGHTQEAHAAWSALAELQPERARAHFNLGRILQDSGRFEEALAAFEEEARIDSPHESIAWFAAGQTLVRLGRYGEALEACRKGSGAGPAPAEDASWIAGVYAKLGFAFLTGSGGGPDFEKAIEAYERAIELEPIGEDMCNLGWVHVGLGDYAQAAAWFEKGHELGSRQPGWSYPSALWLEDWRAVAERESQLLALLEGRADTGDANDLRLAAIVGYARDDFVGTARLWGKAFERQPELAEDQVRLNRYRAILAATLAGCGRGENAEELGDEARQELRDQAGRWLEEELDYHAAQLEDGDPRKRASAIRMLGLLLQGGELAPVREEEALEQWSTPEREKWRGLWDRLARVLSTAQGPPPAKKE